MTSCGCCVVHPAHDLADAFDDRPDREELRIDLHLPGLDLREVEDVVDDAEQVLPGGVDVLEEAEVLRLDLLRQPLRRGSRRSR